MHDAPLLAREIGVARLWVKDEGLNPTASFKARGMSAAVTRARALGVAGFVTPTAGNAGAALAAYGAARISPCACTRQRLRHGRFSTRSACSARAECSWMDTLAMRGSRRARSRRRAATSIRRHCASRIALRVRRRWATRWPSSSSGRLPTQIIYPTGGGTGLIGMWKAFAEMQDGGWLPATSRCRRWSSRRRMAARRSCARSRRASEGDAVGKSDDARERAARPRPPRRPSHSPRAARERWRRARGERGRDRRRHAAALARDGRRCGAGGWMRALGGGGARAPGRVPTMRRCWCSTRGVGRRTGSRVRRQFACCTPRRRIE